MLIDINLLPKKESRNIAMFIIIVTVFILLLSGAIYFYWQVTTMKQTAKQMQQEIDVTTDILTIEQKKLTEFQSMNEIEQLEKAINWTKEQPADVNFIMQHIIKLLPTRGFILDFNLSVEMLQCTIQFDTSAEAAFYLDLLLETDWITNATLTERTTKQLEEEEEKEEVVETTEEMDDVLPRYIANYDIYINLDSVRAETTKDDDKTNTDGGERP